MSSILSSTQQFMPVRRGSLLSNANPDTVSLITGHAKPSPPQYDVYGPYFKNKKMPRGKLILLTFLALIVACFIIGATVYYTA